MNNTRKILVVNDDPVVSKNIEEVLTNQGYAVVVASSGEDALWQFSAGTYDAAFADLLLRGISGLEVAEEIHARQPGLPVVIFTGDGSAAIQERAAAAGVTEFLHKPLSPEQIADAADRLLPARDSDSALQPHGPRCSVTALARSVIFLLAPLPSPQV